VPRYALRLADGSDVGTFAHRSAEWKPGDTFLDRRRVRWRIIDVRDMPEGAVGRVDAVLIVEKLSEPLRYEEMLSALQGWLGEDVAVLIETYLPGGARPVAILSGVLRTGVAINLAHHERPPPRYTRGEAVLFNVDRAVFAVTKAGFKLGRRHADGSLTFQIGRVEFSISLAE